MNGTEFRHLCPNCHKSYKHRITLNRHLRQECGKTPGYTCPYCPIKSKRKENIAAHIRTVHINKEVLYLGLQQRFKEDKNLSV